MATAIKPLRKIQLGMESTKGTLVAATRQIVGDGVLAEEQDFYRSSYPRGVRATVGGAGVITRKGTKISIATELTAEEILWPLLTGIKGNVTGTAGTTDYTWTFTPELTTGIPNLKTATIEFAESDGTTNHIYGEAGHAMTESFKLSWAASDIVKLDWSMFARARQTGSPTGSLSPYSSREALVSSLSSHYLDTSWAGLGTTQLSGLIRGGEFECMTGLAPTYTLEGRSDLDFSDYAVGSVSTKLKLDVELDAGGAARYANYRANDVVYIRTKFTGSTIGGGVKTVQIDGAYRFVSEPGRSEDGDQVLLSLDLEGVYDETGTKMVEFVVVNGLSAVA